MKSFLLGSTFFLLFIYSPLFCAKKSPFQIKKSFDHALAKKVKKGSLDHLKKTYLSRSSDNIIWSENFENNADGWSFNSGWELTSLTYHSPSSSMFSPNSNITFDQYYTLFSPIISLPKIGLNEWLYFTFWLNADLPDYNGNDDSLIDDYYQVDINYPSDKPAFHISSFDSNFETSFWCGDEGLSGYKDGWIQYLDMPALSVPSSGGSLKVNMKWTIEDTVGAVGSDVSAGWIDGWDAFNVRISEDGGSTWSILIGDYPYDFYSGYGWLYNGFEPGQDGVYSLASGWSGNQDWRTVSFDLDNYAEKNVIVRFAFGSDPAYSTIDEPSLNGVFIDDIIFENEAGVLISYSTEDIEDEVFNTTGYQWDDLFYDYNVEFCIDSDLQTLPEYTTKEDCELNNFFWYSRPGSAGWEEYLPGDPICDECNYFLDLNKYSGKDITLRFWSRYDDNHDGGQGEGLYIDDINLYRESLQIYSEPQLFNAGIVDNEVKLSWYDLNSSGDSLLFFKDQDPNFFSGLTLSECENCTAFAGTLFPAWLGEATVDSIMIYNINETSVQSQINAYSLIDNSPVYNLNINLSPLSWNYFDVDWNFSSVFLLSHLFSDQKAAAFNPYSSESGLWYLSSDVGSWEYVTLDQSPIYGSWALAARVEYEGLQEVTYNLYRDGALLENSLNGTSFIDLTVDYNTSYYYHLSAVYPDGTEVMTPDSITVTSPQPPIPEGVIELSNSDNDFEAEFNAGLNNYSATRFENSLGSSSYLYMLKWYQKDEGGAFYIKVFNDVNGLPGVEIFSKIQSGNQLGWNQKVFTDSLIVADYFWVGFKEFSATRPFGLDTTSISGTSLYKEGESGDWEALKGNLAVKSFISSELLSNSNFDIMPKEYGIQKVYPNPFNPLVEIKFSVQELSNIQLSVYDLSGAIIQRLFNDLASPGSYSIAWDASNSTGGNISSGIYILAMDANGSRLSTRKIVFVK